MSKSFVRSKALYKIMQGAFWSKFYETHQTIISMFIVKNIAFLKKNTETITIFDNFVVHKCILRSFK